MLRINGFLLAVFATTTHCGSTGQEEIRYPIYGAGRTVAPFIAGSWEVTLDVARVGLGPVYFCTSEAASSSLCPTAVAEFASSETINALDPNPQLLGEVFGITGTIRSATYDYALTWFPTQRMPRATRSAPQGHSAHFEGRARRADRAFRFIADIDVVPMIQGTRAVQGARVTAHVGSSRVRLDVRVDAQAWWQAVDFDELAAQGSDSAAVSNSSLAHNAVVIRMTSTSLPTFEWSNQ